MFATRAGDWSRALVLSDVLMRDASLLNGPQDPGMVALQRGLASCLQRMGCTDLLQTYWRGVPGRNEGAASGMTPSPRVPHQASGMLPRVSHRCQARGLQHIIYEVYNPRLLFVLTDTSGARQCRFYRRFSAGRRAR